MAEKNVNVKTTLKLDDLASALLKKIQGGFAETQQAAESASSTFSEWAQTAGSVAMALGINLSDVTSKVYAFGKGLVMTAAEGQAADHAIAGLIATVQGRDWASAAAEAAELGDSLDLIAANAGVAGDGVQAALQTVLEFTGATEKGVESAKKSITDIATISGVLGKNTEGIAREYAMMVEGTVRTKGQLFQLLQTTGIFGKETKKAAEFWSKMTEEDRIRQLAYGMGEVAGKLSKATPSFKQLLTSIETMWDVAKEKLGEPFVEALSPVLKELIVRMKAAGPAVESFAKSMAKDVGVWVKGAAQMIESGFQYIKTHKDEIAAAIKDAFMTAKKVVEFILAHKEEIAVAFGAHALANSPIGRGIGSIYGAGAKGGAVTGMGSLGGLGAGGGMLGGAATVAAFAAAVVAWGVAIDQWSDLMARTEGGKSEAERDQLARKRALEGMREGQKGAEGLREWDPAEIKRFEQLRKSFVEAASELGESSRAAGDLADSVFRAHRAARGQVEQFDKAIAAYQALAESGVDMAATDFTGMASMFATGFQNAISTNNDAVAQYIANLVTKSKELQSALLFSSELTAEGFTALAQMVEGKSKEFAELLRSAGAQKAEAAKPAAPKIHMSGGQVFKIQQDFRDQDPDRVAFVFQRDIAKAAERRIQASTVSPFGT